MRLERSKKNIENKSFDFEFDYFDNDFNPEVRLYNKIRDIVTNPENFLNRGAAGKVFSLGNGLCIKMIFMEDVFRLRDEFDINDPNVEFQIQLELQELRFEDARIPKVIATKTGEDVSFIIMEEIDGMNLNDVFHGREELPENFEYNRFFDQLYGLVEKMHNEYGISHGDLYRRNLMVDIQGNPVLIDFGLSKRFCHRAKA